MSVVLCPRGHRVHVTHDGRGHCGTCEHVWPKEFLIDTKGHGPVGKQQYGVFARAYRAGYEAARRGPK